jgi:2-polyprenyl-6-methoxyphenol hydroxylase-like FAD-dependent oxidoreductase
VSGIPPLRVAIAGGGPGGLTLARALNTLPGRPCVATVYEAQQELRPAVGGGLLLSSGADVLSRLGLDMSRVGTPLRTVLSRKADGGEVLRVDVQSAMRRAGATQLGGDGNGAFSVMRDTLQSTLVASLPEGALRLGMPFASATPIKGGGVSCVFGGEMVEADVLVGFDGIASSVAAKCFSGGLLDRFYDPADSGIRALFCIAPGGARPDGSGDQFHQWLGDGGYALSAAYGTGHAGELQEMVVLCTTQTPAEEAGLGGAVENTGWEEGGGRLREAAMDRAVAAGMPTELTNVIQASARFYETAVRFRPPRLGWSRHGRIVLAGDAAHAMPPFLGQGANQAICDAYALASLLKRVAPGGSPAGALDAFERARLLPTASLFINSRILGFLETQSYESFPGAAFRDFFFFVTGKLGIAKTVFLDGALPKGLDD